jgi:L-lactate dehydrogenase (cytochrome)
VLNRCQNILDLRHLARKRLPTPIFNILDGGAESEVTLRRNTAAFDDLKLIPKCLVNVANVKTSTRIFGQRIEWPVYCSPAGFARIFHPHGELAVARAAARSGTLYGVSTASSYSMEAVAAATRGPKLFQLYVCKDRGLTRELIARAKSSGFCALCVTVNFPVGGKCERELRSNVIGPPYKWPLPTLLGFARHPGWAMRRIADGTRLLANFAGPDGKAAHPQVFAEQLDPSVTWADISQVAAWWGGPIALKGVLSVDVARTAADAGVTAVIVGNHGGRQLDGAAASIEVVAEIADAVGDRLEVIFDGGVRRGVHVLKALACGAKACSVGRAYLYGLAAGGESGVAKALEILRTELVLAMQLAGCPDLSSIDKQLIRRFS